MRYITIRYTKNKRLTIGTRIHKDINCSKINPAAAKPVTGEILKLVPRCKECFKK